MPEFKPEPETFLDNCRMRFQNTLLEEVADLQIASVSCPLGQRARLEDSVRTSWFTELPEPGRSTASADGRVKIFSMAPDQFFVFPAAAPQAAGAFVAETLGSAGYVTDQSDNWVGLRISGELALPALERICPIDLDPAVFPTGAVARTLMEHLGAIIHREGPEQFLLLSASSSACSFLHAVATSLRNVDIPQE